MAEPLFVIDSQKIAAHLRANWKSTLLGWCVFVLAVLRSFHFDDAGHFAMTPRDWCGVAVGSLTAIVGTSMVDAGKVIAKTPSGEVKPVDSTETPVDPDNTVVGQ